MSAAMTLGLDEIKSLLRGNDLNSFSINELYEMKQVLRANSLADPEVSTLLSGFEALSRDESFAARALEADFIDYKAAADLVAPQTIVEGQDATYAVARENRLAAAAEQIFGDTEILQRLREEDSLSPRLGYKEVAEIAALFDNLPASTDEYEKTIRSVADENIRNYVARDQREGIYSLSDEDYRGASYLLENDNRSIFATESDKEAFRRSIETARDVFEQENADTLDVLLEEATQEEIDANAMQLNRVASAVSSESLLEEDADLKNIWQEVEIPVLKADGSIAEDWLEDETGKQKYWDSVVNSAVAAVIKDSLTVRNPFGKKAKSAVEQLKSFKKKVADQISADILTMRLATKADETLFEQLKKDLNIAAPRGKEAEDGSLEQLKYNQKVARKVAEVFSNPKLASKFMQRFQNTLDDVRSDGSKLRIDPRQFLANQAEKQAEIGKLNRDSLKRAKKQGLRKIAGAAMILNRQEHNLKMLGERVYGRVYNVAVAAKEFANNNPGKATELLGTLGISAGSAAMGLTSVASKFGMFGIDKSAAQAFLNSGWASGLAGAMVLHTACKGYVYPVVTEWKKLRETNPIFESMSFRQKYLTARAEAKKKNPDLDIYGYTALGAMATAGVAGLFGGPAGAKVGAAAAIAVGNYIIKKRDADRIEKLYKETGDEKYREALYGNAKSEEIEKATGFKKYLKKAVNVMAAKRNQKWIALGGAVMGVVGVSVRLNASHLDTALGLVATKAHAAELPDSLSQAGDSTRISLGAGRTEAINAGAQPVETEPQLSSDAQPQPATEISYEWSNETGVSSRQYERMKGLFGEEKFKDFLTVLNDKNRFTLPEGMTPEQALYKYAQLRQLAPFAQKATIEAMAKALECQEKIDLNQYKDSLALIDKNGQYTGEWYKETCNVTNKLGAYDCDKHEFAKDDYTKGNCEEVKPLKKAPEVKPDDVKPMQKPEDTKPTADPKNPAKPIAAKMPEVEAPSMPDSVTLEIVKKTENTYVFLNRFKYDEFALAGSLDEKGLPDTSKPGDIWLIPDKKDPKMLHIYRSDGKGGYEQALGGKRIKAKNVGLVTSVSEDGKTATVEPLLKDRKDFTVAVKTDDVPKDMRSELKGSGKAGQKYNVNIIAKAAQNSR